MVLVDITLNEKVIKKIVVKGHSNFATKGKDIVCAGISTVVIGGFNNLKRIEDYVYQVEEGLALVDTQDIVDSKDQIVLETIMTQLKTIEMAYPKSIKINILKGK